MGNIHDLIFFENDAKNNKKYVKWQLGAAICNRRFKKIAIANRDTLIDTRQYCGSHMPFKTIHAFTHSCIFAFPLFRKDNQLQG
jgi:hypothetical protein